MNLHGRLVRIEMLQWHIAVTIVIIVQHGMTLTERATFCVLSCEAHSKTFAGDARKGQRFGGGPIERLRAGGHLLARLQEFFDLWVRPKILRQSSLDLEPKDRKS